MLGKKFKVYLYNCYFCLYDNCEYELSPSYLLPFCPALFGTLLLRDKCSKESSNPNFPKRCGEGGGFWKIYPPELPSRYRVQPFIIFPDMMTREENNSIFSTIALDNTNFPHVSRVNIFLKKHVKKSWITVSIKKKILP